MKNNQTDFEIEIDRYCQTCWIKKYVGKSTIVNIPSRIDEKYGLRIGEGAFLGCNHLVSVTISEGVTMIEDMAFTDCKNLVNISLPQSLTTIATRAFIGCVSLSSVTIPKGVMWIERQAFSSCHSLERIVVEQGNPVYDSRENCNAIIETTTNTLIKGCKNTVIPNGVEVIDTVAFYN